MNEFDVEICYPDEIADPFYEEEDLRTGAESEEEIKQFFASGCINEMHYV